jgi:hypothetical protein
VEILPAVGGLAFWARATDSGDQGAPAVIDRTLGFYQTTRHCLGVVQLDELLLMPVGEPLQGGLARLSQAVLTLLLISTGAGSGLSPLARTAAGVVTVGLRGVGWKVLQRKISLTSRATLGIHGSILDVVDATCACNEGV